MIKQVENYKLRQQGNIFKLNSNHKWNNAIRCNTIENAEYEIIIFLLGNDKNNNIQ